jgi:hypothetical protein
MAQPKAEVRYRTKGAVRSVPAPPEGTDAFLASMRSVIRHYARRGRPIRVEFPGLAQPQFVLFDTEGRIKQFLGSTIPEAMQVNPVAAGRLLSAGERSLANWADSSKPIDAKKPTKRISERRMLQVGLKAFWTLAERWHLSVGEQCALLAVSKRTRTRWKAKPPTSDAMVMDRLRVILLTYRRLVELTSGGADAETAMVFRQAGSADNPESPTQSLLEALCDRSVLAMDRHYQRLVALIHAS